MLRPPSLAIITILSSTGLKLTKLFLNINGTVVLSDVGIFSSTSSGYQLNQVQAAPVALVSYQGSTVSSATNIYNNLIPNVTLSLSTNDRPVITYNIFSYCD